MKSTRQQFEYNMVGGFPICQEKNRLFMDYGNQILTYYVRLTLNIAVMG